MQKKITASFNKSAKRYDKYAFLQRYVADILFDKLSMLQDDFSSIIDVGCGTGYLTEKMEKNQRLVALDMAIEMCKIVKCDQVVCGQATALPFIDHNFDLVISNLMIQWLFGNPDEFFLESLRVLQPKGMLLLSSFGPDTLQELHSVTQEVSGKAHVNQQLDMHIIGDKLRQAGFVDVVMDRIPLQVEYSFVKDLLTDLRGVGANLVNSEVSASFSKSDYQKIIDLYTSQFSRGNKIIATYEIVFAQAWSPASIKNQVPLSSVKRK